MNEEQDGRRSIAHPDSYQVDQMNMYKTCKRFSLNPKMAMRWVKDEEKIRATKKGSKRVNFPRTPDHPQMETQLYQ